MEGRSAGYVSPRPRGALPPAASQRFFVRKKSVWRGLESEFAVGSVASEGEGSDARPSYGGWRERNGFGEPGLSPRRIPTHADDNGRGLGWAWPCPAQAFAPRRPLLTGATSARQPDAGNCQKTASGWGTRTASEVLNRRCLRRPSTASNRLSSPRKVKAKVRGGVGESRPPQERWGVPCRHSWAAPVPPVSELAFRPAPSVAFQVFFFFSPPKDFQILEKYLLWGSELPPFSKGEIM